MKLSQKVIEKEHQKRKYTHKMATEHDKMSKELDMKLKLQRDKMKVRLSHNLIWKIICYKI